MVGVPDPRLAALARLYNSARIVPASVRFTDIAGLVQGASQGQGLGNQFLGHIRETDAICQVVRVFADPDVTRVEGSADPEGDIETVVTELILADLQTLEKAAAPAGEGDEVLQGPGEARGGRGGPGGRGGARRGQDAVRRGGGAPGSRSPRCASCTC